MKGAHTVQSGVSATNLFHFPLHAMQNILKMKWFMNQTVWATKSIKTGRSVIQKRKTVNVYFNKEAGEKSLNWTPIWI